MEIYIVDTKERLRRIDATKFGRDILQRILREKFPNIDALVKVDVRGKPFIANIPKFHFNISHSGQKIVIATDSVPVGVDIERVRDVNLKIVDHFFSDEDIKNFYEVSLEDRLEYFFKTWTQKESYVKCIGMGFSGMPFRKFTIVDDKYGEYLFSTYDLVDGYKMSVCQSGDTDKKIIYITA